MPALEEMHHLSLTRMRETGAVGGGVGAGCREEPLTDDDARLTRELTALLTSMRADYLALLARMGERSGGYGAQVRAQLAAELERRAVLRQRERHLMKEIDELVGDGLVLLKQSLKGVREIIRAQILLEGNLPFHLFEFCKDFC
jgi:transposase